MRVLLLALIAGSWGAPEACADWMVGGSFSMDVKREAIGADKIETFERM